MKFMNMKRVYMQEAVSPEAAAPSATPATPPAATPTPSTPPATPVAATPEVKPEPVQLNYNNPAAKQAGDMLSAAGVDPVKARDAITANGGQCTPEIYQALVNKHGEGMASLLANQMTQLHKAGVEKGKESDQAVYTQVEEAFKGVTTQTGEETWKELSAWAKTNVDAAQQVELNKVLSQGGLAAKLAVQELITMFQGSGDYAQEMVGLEGDNRPAAPKGGDLTRGEYNAELDKLLAKGHSYETSSEVKALQVRRARSAQRGI